MPPELVDTCEDCAGACMGVMERPPTCRCRALHVEWVSGQSRRHRTSVGPAVKSLLGVFHVPATKATDGESRSR